MRRSELVLLQVFAAGFMLLASCGAAFAQDTIVQRSNVVRVNTIAPAGREALDEGVTRVAVQAAFGLSSDPQTQQQKLLGLLLLLSTAPSNGRSSR